MDKLQGFIDENFDNMLEDLKRLISINSVIGEKKPDAPFGEAPKQALLEMLKICEKHGLKTKNFDNYVGTAQWGDNPKLGILSHLDIVPVDKNWDTDPFCATIKDGILYGRGAIDDKGPSIASLYALLSVIASGKQPDGGVKLIFGTDEECGSRDIEYYRHKDVLPPMIYSPDCNYPIVNIEKGLVRIAFTCPAQEESNVDLVNICASEVVNVVPKTTVATLKGVDKENVKQLIAKDDSKCNFRLNQKGNLLEIECEGLGVHASKPHNGNNSLTAMLELLSKLEINSKRFHLIKELHKLFPHKDTSGKTAKIYSFDEESGETTLAFTVLNIEQGVLKGELDVRYPLSTTKEAIIHKLGDQLSALGFSANSYLNNDVHYVDKNSPFIETLLDVCQEFIGLERECVTTGGGTYVHEIENGVGFGPEMPGQKYNMHMANEFIPLEQLKRDTRLQAEAIIRLATK